jgi:hypothetical protein
MLPKTLVVGNDDKLVNFCKCSLRHFWNLNNNTTTTFLGYEETEYFEHFTW